MMQWWLASVAILAATETSIASPTIIGADGSYGRGRFGSNGLVLLGFRVEASHEVERLRLGGSMSFVRSATEDEGETSIHTAFSNPALRARYAVLTGELELGVSAGVIAAIDDDTMTSPNIAKRIYGSFESIRRPYELAPRSAVPLVVDLVHRRGLATATAELGAYFVSDDGLLLDAMHAAVGGNMEHGAATFGFRVHAFFVAGGADVPLYYEKAQRSYFGIELELAFRVSAYQQIRAGLWKPFGFDSPDAAESLTSWSLGTQLRF